MATCRDNIDAVMHRRAISPDVFIAPTLAGSWIPYGTPYAAPGYYRDVTNRVWLRGLLSAGPTPGTSTQAPPATITTLPAGYTPGATAILMAQALTGGSVSTSVRLDLTSAGVLTFTSQFSGTNVFWISLEGLSFSVN